jgi:hypothetical protein
MLKENLVAIKRLMADGAPTSWTDDWGQILPAASYLFFGEKLGEHDFAVELDRARHDINILANIRNTSAAFSALQNVAGLAQLQRRKFTFREFLVR